MNNDDMYNTNSNSATRDVYSAPKPELENDVYIDIFNPPDRSDLQSRLSESRENKLKSLTKLNNNANLDDSYTQFEDGRVESNANKIYNDLSDKELQSLLAFTRQEKRLNENSEGPVTDKYGNVFDGSTRRFYSGFTKNANSTAYKVGLSRGDKPDSSYRYDPEKGGWVSGELGIDSSNFESDDLYDYGVATMIEAVMHGRKKAMEGRVVPDIYEDPYSKDLYGSGVTEYYKSKEALLGAPAEADLELGKKLFDEYMSKVPQNQRQFKRNIGGTVGYLLNDGEVDTASEEFQRLKALGQKAKEEQGYSFGDVLDTALNSAGGFASSFVNELLVKPVDAVGDLTGLYDLDTDGDTQSSVEKFFGYNPESAKYAMERVGEQWDKVADSELPTADRVRAAANGMLEVFTTPEMLTTSLGMLMAWVSPGAVLKAVGVGSKYANTVKRVDTLVDAGKLSKTAGRAKKAKAFMSVDGAKNFLVSQSGYITSAVGNVNHQYEEFVANNNGQELEGQEKAKWFAGRFAVQMVNQNLDKLVDFNVMKSAGAVRALVPAVKAMTQKEFTTFASTVAKGVVVTAKNAGSEAAQEYSQTMMELFNSRYGSEQFKDLDTFNKFLSDTRNAREGGIAALAGAGGSGQFEVAGSILPVAAFGSQALANSTAGILANNNTPQTNNAPQAPITEDELFKARDSYGKLLSRVGNYVNNESIDEKNIDSLLNDLDEINATKYIIETADPEKAKAGEEYYTKVVDKLESFITKNPRLKLSKRLVRKTIEESVADRDVSSNTESIPTETKTAFSALARATGNGEQVDDKTAINNVLNLFKSGEFSSVVVEEGTLDDELKNLEKALTGNVSENLEETFDVIQEQLRGKKPNNFAVQEEAGKVLGSGPVESNNVPDEFEEQDYDDYTRSLTAERILRTVLGSKENVSNDFKTKAAVFGIANGISKANVKEIIKSYASVEDEAVSGNRGYKTRLNRIKGLVSSSSPNKKVIEKEKRELSSMYTTVLNSATALERGIKDAKQKAVELNKFSTTNKSSVQVKTEYKKFDGSKYVINIMNNNGTWKADVAGAKNLVKTKTKYTDDIAKGLEEIGVKTGETTAPNSGKLVVPVKEYKSKSLREKDVNYLDKIAKVAAEVSPGSDGVSKVILGQKTHTKWDSKGDYYKSNSSIINSETFTDKDVVLIDSTAIRTSRDGKRYVPDLGPEAKKSLKAAMEAGATIVLDSAMINGTEAIKNPKWASAIAGYINPKKSGYSVLSGTDKYIFVKSTPEKKKAIRTRQAQFKQEKADKATVTANKTRAVSLFRALKQDLDVSTGEELTGKRRTELAEEYKNVRTSLLESSFKGDKDKLDSYLSRESVDEIAREATAILKDPEATPPVYKDVVLQQSVEQFIATEVSKDSLVDTLLSDWKDISGQGMSKKERESGVKELLSKLNLASKSLINSVLGEKSFSKGKNDLYESIYESVSTGEIRGLPLRKNMTAEEYDALVAINDKPGAHKKFSKKHLFKGVRRVVQDITKIVEVSKTTVANSVPLEYLPFSIRNEVENFNKNAVSALEAVSILELAEQTDGKATDGSFNLHNSPARGLFFNNEGKVNEEVLAATYLALGDLMVGDKSAMSRGWKSDYDVAQMFGVQEFEVTYEMRKFAYEHGSLLKTAANTLGKNIMSQLGITKKVGDDISANEYEALLSDIGNTALLIAEEQNILTSVSIESNKMAKLYRDGVERKTESMTHFVHISDVKDKTSKFQNNVHSKKASEFVETYKEVAETIPEASTSRKEPSFDAPLKEKIDEATSSVRNDISGKQVPKDAKETIQILMETPYTVDVERIDEILDAVADENNNVKKLLGYVDLESKEFKNLYFKDKEVQQAKNDAIDKSIKELELLIDKVKNSKFDKTELYFDYFYSSNDRYMLDSNTINPQVDKLHRFLIVPKEHKLDYEVSKNANGGVEFSTVKGLDADKDQSFTVRMAIAQAFGQSVDKMAATDIIDFGNVMLSMSVEQLSDIKKEMLNTGEIKVTADGKEYKLEAEHLSHTLQAIQFLNETQRAIEGDGKMTSSLSLEFDSLTSGFANKIQQMPILSDMHEHLARTGVLTMQYQNILKNAVNYKGNGLEFSPENGQSIADVLAIVNDGKPDGSDGKIEFLDSYKTMAKVTINKLKEGEKQRENLTQSSKKGMNSGASIFEIVKPLLPGGEFIDAGDGAFDITSTIRNLFKNPFMIFNYSASIGRIVRNLGNDVAHDIAKGIAMADFSNPAKSGVKLVAENLVKSLKLVDKENNNKPLNTAADLQAALKGGRLKSIELSTPLVVVQPKKGDAGIKVRNLEDALESVVKATYGEVVKDVFTESFGPFVETQDAMNDTFKVAFRIFDKKRVDRLKEIQKTKEDRVLTAKDHAQVLEELWDDFPWIVGPLSGADSKKDVISVVTTSVRSPSSIEESRKKPQALRNSGKDSKSRTVSPLVKYLEEAVSSGSVLPFHAIDGAEISKVFVATKLKGIAAIHDAIIPPLNESDRTGFEYQKGMVETNSDYVLVDALNKLAERMFTTISKAEFDKEFKDVSVIGLKTLDSDTDYAFPKAAKEIAANMTSRVRSINAERSKWYGEGGLLEGAWYGNLVGTPGAMYRTAYTDDAGNVVPASSEADLTYKEKFKEQGLYKTLTTSIGQESVVTDRPSTSTDVKVDENTSLKDTNSSTSNGVSNTTKGCK